MRLTRRLVFLSISCLGMLVCGLGTLCASAAEPSDSEAKANTGLEEIVVTAEKRSSNVQTTPLAMSALRGEDLEAHQINDIGGLAQAVPNVDFGQSTGNARISIRGIGYDQLTVGSEARVAYHLDGIYLSRPASVLGTYFDVDRIEVVSGPQGTLYGRNATAGAVNVLTRNPTDSLEGYVDVALGNYDENRVVGAIGGAIANGVDERFAFQTVNRSGYGENITTGVDVDDQHAVAFRNKVDFKLGDYAHLLVSGDYMQKNDHADGFHYLGVGSPYFTPLGFVYGGTYPSNPRDTANPLGPDNHRKFYGFSADFHAALGAVDFQSISGYRYSHYRLLTDILGAGIPVVDGYTQGETSDQFSQEFRISQSNLSWGDWLLGAYYFHEHTNGFTEFPYNREVLGLPSLLVEGYFAGGELSTDAYAAFGQSSYHITDEVTAVAGLRYSAEKKHVIDVLANDVSRSYSASNLVIPNVTQDDSHTWYSATPKATLEYQPRDHLFLYATYSQGFKSGGYNLGGVQPAFAPEKLTDYEVGTKAEWLQGRLRTNFSAFYYDYSNLQVSEVVGTAVQTVNAASANVKGMEAQITAIPVKNVRVELNVGLLNAKYDQFLAKDSSRLPLGTLSLAGNQLTQAPKYTVDIAAQYTWNESIGDVTLRGEARLIDRVYFTPFNTAAASQPGHDTENIFLNYEAPSGTWTGSVYVRNLTDERTIGYALVASGIFVGAPVIGTLDPPRTFGVEARYRF